MPYWPCRSPCPGVQALGGRTDELEVPRVLQRDLLRRRQLRRLATSAPYFSAAGRRVEDLARLGAAGIRIDVPGRGRVDTSICERPRRHAAGGPRSAADRVESPVA